MSDEVDRLVSPITDLETPGSTTISCDIVYGLITNRASQSLARYLLIKKPPGIARGTSAILPRCHLPLTREIVSGKVSGNK